MAAEKIVNLTRLARRAAKLRMGTCKHNWVRRRSGAERCSLCRDQFPCRKLCEHVDCWTRRLDLGLVRHYPTEHALRSLVITDPEQGVIYDTTDEDPVNWVLPVGDTSW